MPTADAPRTNGATVVSTRPASCCNQTLCNLSGHATTSAWRRLAKASFPPGAATCIAACCLAAPRRRHGAFLYFYPRPFIAAGERQRRRPAPPHPPPPRLRAKPTKLHSDRGDAPAAARWPARCVGLRDIGGRCRPGPDKERRRARQAPWAALSCRAVRARRQPPFLGAAQSEAGPRPDSPAKPGRARPNPTQPKPTRPSPAQPGLAQPAQRSPAELSRVCLAQLRLAWPGPIQISPARPRAAGPTQPSPARASPGGRHPCQCGS